LVIELEAPGFSGEIQQAGLQMQAVGLVEVAVLVGEGEGHGPEIARGCQMSIRLMGCVNLVDR